jgi:hypothetical protein
MGVFGYLLNGAGVQAVPFVWFVSLLAFVKWFPSRATGKAFFEEKI